ncbi:MAG TPA: hypothetical protein VF041_13060 [Gemmatimonadaceae bacterium]
MSRARVPLAAALLLAGAVAPARAQFREPARVQPAGRVDVLASHITAIQAGTELSLPAGRALRLSLVGGAGGSWADGRSGLSARAELAGRFLLDPNFSARWAPYVGGGGGARYDHIAGWRAVLVVFVGMEGPNWNGVIPFVEVGYGGGGRIGLGLRKTRGRGR